MHRPEMLRGWARATAPDGPDGRLAGGAVAAAARADRPAEPGRAAATRVPAAPRGPDGCSICPARVSLFGLTRLPRSYLDVLARSPPRATCTCSSCTRRRRCGSRCRETLAAGAPVDPPPRGSDGSAGRRTGCSPPGAATRASCSSSSRPRARAPTIIIRSRVSRHAARPDPGRRPRRPPAARAAAARPAGRAPPLDPDDRSVQVHACHGRARQVEVLRDAILHLLGDDPTLEPRDVIVMCPDIETFAPLIQATFGAGRVRGRRSTSRGPRAIERQAHARPARPARRPLAAPDQPGARRGRPAARARRSARSPRRRCSTSPTASRSAAASASTTTTSRGCRTGSRTSGIRWGLDAAHRAPFKLDVLPKAPGAPGLDRVLLGVTMTEEDQRLVGGVLPLDDVESGAIDLAGRFAEFVDRLQDGGRRARPAPSRSTAGPRRSPPPPTRSTATASATAWQRRELQRVLDDVLGDGHGARGRATRSLALAEVRALLADRLRGRPTRANFRTGHLTICTLVPMRSVPHRVVCLLGLDDGAFPRRAPRDGDDLMLADPHVGDRDPRSEDRQLLLDALLAATERLVITYTGNDERTNLPRPPAVPVGELLDVGRRTVSALDPGAAREQVARPPPAAAVRPPQLRRPGGSCPERPWSFDHVALDGARALSGARTEPGSLPRRDRCRRREHGGDRARRPGPVRRAPGARVPAPAARDQRPRVRRRGRGRAARRARRPRQRGGSASGCSTASLAGVDARGMRPGRDRPRVAAAGTCSAEPVLAQVRPIVQTIAGRGADARRGRAGARVDVNLRLDRRAHAQPGPCPACAAGRSARSPTRA